MDLQISVRHLARHVPGVEPVSVEVELHEPKRTEVCKPDGVLVYDQVERQSEAVPRVYVPDPSGIVRRAKDVDPAAGAIEREDKPPRPDRDRVDAVELTRCIPTPAELADVLRISIENQDAMVVEPVGYQDPSIRKEGDILGLREMEAVVAWNAFLAKREK